MFLFPCHAALQRLQPLVFRDGALLTMGSHGDGSAALVGAFGDVHPLSCLLSAAALAAQTRRLNGAAARTWLEAELTRRLAHGVDPLRYFVESLAPAFLARDADEGYATDLAAAPPPPADLSEEVEAAVALLPAPEAPNPSLWLFGRVWPLHAAAATTKRMHVVLGNQTFGLHNQPTVVSALRIQWEAKVRGYLTEAATRLAISRSHKEASPQLDEAADAVARTGEYRVGDLFYLAGPPPRVGHVIPPHHNRTLGRSSRRDLALTVPLGLPPTLTPPAVFQRQGDRWTPLPLPHGLCLGEGPPPDRPETPGLALAAYLRWAAQRVASNGAFHSNDLAPREESYDYS